MRLIAHRGWWWPRRDLQNHPAAILNALSVGFGVEIDVWTVSSGGLRLGHDKADHLFTPPADGPLREMGGPLMLHLKGKQSLRGIFDTLLARKWLPYTYAFFSPSDDAGLDEILHETPAVTDGPKRLVTVDNVDALDVLLSLPDPLGGADGVWLEQPEGDWVQPSMLGYVQAAGKSAWIVSSELHGHKLDLGNVVDCWSAADGICTDYPHLLAKVLDQADPMVHPKEPWW